MAVATATVRVRADTSEYERAMQRTQDVAAASAKRSGEVMTSSWGAAAKKVQQSSLVAELETISALGIQAGGSVSRLASVVTSLIRPMAIVTAAAGPAGIAIAGVGIAALGAVGGARALVNAAVQAEEELRKMGLAVEHDAGRPLRDFTAASGALSGEIARLKVQIGSELAPAFTGLARATGTAVSAWAKAHEATKGFRDTMLDLGRAQLQVGTLGMSELVIGLGSLVTAAGPAEQAMRDLAEASRTAAEENNDYLKGLLANVDAQLGQYDAARALLKPLEAPRTKQRAKDAVTMADIERGLQEFTRDQERETARLQREIEREHMVAKMDVERTMHERTQALRDEAEAEDIARKEREVERAVDAFKRIAAEAAAMTDAAAQIASPYFETISTAFEHFDARASRTHEHITDLQAENVRLAEDWRHAEDRNTRASIAQRMMANRAFIDGSRAVLDEQRKAALRLWQGDQASKIGQAVMAGSLAVMQSYAQLGPIAGSFAAAGIATLTATQVALIARQKPPKYHLGGRFGDSSRAADERDVRVLASEGAVTTRGMNMLGSEGLKQVNEGRMPVQVTLHHTTVIDGKVIERTVRKLTARGTRNIHADG